MKIRVKIKDMVEMLIFQDYKSFSEKYHISSENIKLIIDALYNKKWKVV